MLQELDADDIAAWVLTLPNRLKVRFEIAVEARYNKHDPPARFAVELGVLIGVRDELKKRCEER